MRAAKETLAHRGGFHIVVRFGGWGSAGEQIAERMPTPGVLGTAAVRGKVTTIQGKSMMNRIVPAALILMSLTISAQAAQVRATWYGHELHGKRTASGEAFNANGMTAAHRSLPFGTCLLVGNPRTGKTVSVRVNDRGPFTSGLSLDLSLGAARAIGMRSTQNVTMRRC